MADQKITALTAQTAGGLALADLLMSVDLSDITMDASGANKKITEQAHAAGLRTLLTAFSTGLQGAGFATDTYLTGSAITIPTDLTAGAMYRCIFDVTKTAAGTAAPVINIRVGTAGTTADTSRGTHTFSAGTAAAGTGVFELTAMLRTVGASTSAVLVSICQLEAPPTTVISSLIKATSAVSGGFDSTVASTKIGLSVNGGTSAAWTVQFVRAELIL